MKYWSTKTRLDKAVRRERHLLKLACNRMVAAAKRSQEVSRRLERRSLLRHTVLRSGLKQDAIAAQAGLSRGAISHFLTGARTLSAKKLESLEAAVAALSAS